MNRRLFNRIFASAGFLTMTWGTTVHAFSHKYLNQNRSGTNTTVFVNQSVEGEFGKYTLLTNDSNAELQKGKTTINWQGYGLRTGVGVEVMKFIQFGVSHTLSNMRSLVGQSQRFSGSKLSGDVKFIFASPLGNLEAGAGALGSRLDYQKTADFGSYYGSGAYYSLGLNYYMTPAVSVFTQARMLQEHLVRNAGTETLPDFSTNTTSIGAGFSLWI